MSHQILRLNGNVFTMGRIVHYINREGDGPGNQKPFLLTECKRNGTVRADGILLGCDGHAAVFLQDVPYDPTKRAGTFHFPSFQKKKKGPIPGQPLRKLPVDSSAKLS
jgi:hypothetical protein